ncbi:hypothetical protein l13_16680 [Neisseria weaveri ATCC 51223]|nr:hypothetical protein l13_16680 [Neisseria weaveri ATCC 51223]
MLLLPILVNGENIKNENTSAKLDCRCRAFNIGRHTCLCFENL